MISFLFYGWNYKDDKTEKYIGVLIMCFSNSLTTKGE